MTNPPNTRLAESVADRLEDAAKGTRPISGTVLRQASALLREQDERIAKLEGALREAEKDLTTAAKVMWDWGFEQTLRTIRSSLASKEGSAARDLRSNASGSDLSEPGKGGVSE